MKFFWVLLGRFAPAFCFLLLCFPSSLPASLRNIPHYECQGILSALAQMDSTDADLTPHRISSTDELTALDLPPPFKNIFSPYLAKTPPLKNTLYYFEGYPLFEFLGSTTRYHLGYMWGWENLFDQDRAATLPLLLKALKKIIGGCFVGVGLGIAYGSSYLFGSGMDPATAIFIGGVPAALVLLGTRELTAYKEADKKLAASRDPRARRLASRFQLDTLLEIIRDDLSEPPTDLTTSARVTRIGLNGFLDNSFTLAYGFRYIDDVPTPYLILGAQYRPQAWASVTEE